jgi:uncharacterized repeat protein (TIGR03803 family)
MRLISSTALLTAAALVPITAAAGTQTVLHSFLGEGAGDGDTPYAAPVMDAHGNLYGTTLYGGLYGAGIAYRLHRTSGGSWRETVLWSFGGSGDGSDPEGGVIVDKKGNLYGGTRFGGNQNCDGIGCGVVYELSPAGGGTWNETVLYQFPGMVHGGEGGPVASLTFDGKGNLYGTTTGDDTCGGGYDGTVFELKHTSTGWKKHELHDFCGSDGQAPAYGALVFDSAGNLYGTTGFGGAGGVGVVFELSPLGRGQWAFTAIHDFTQEEGGVADGGLTIDSTGNLYGAEADGGPNIDGAIYEFSPAGGGQWTENILHTFNGSPDGLLPFQNPEFDSGGNLFGTTYGGGNIGSCYDDCGTIYQLTPQGGGRWSESVVYNFASLGGGADGYQPVAGLVRDAVGNFYGATTKGGAVQGKRPCDCGAVFEFTP